MAYASYAEAAAAWQSADQAVASAYEALATHNTTIRGSFGNQSQRTSANVARQAAVEAVDSALVARKAIEDEMIQLRRGG